MCTSGGDHLLPIRTGSHSNFYRMRGRETSRLTDAPITMSTNFVDSGTDLGKENTYYVRPVLVGEEQEASASSTVPANALVQPYVAIPLQKGARRSQTRSVTRLVVIG